MFLSHEIKNLLCTKLEFTFEQAEAVSKDVEKSTAVIDLMETLRDNTVGRDRKRGALSALYRIRDCFNTQQDNIKTVLNKAYNEYYSFKGYKPNLGFGII